MSTDKEKIVATFGHKLRNRVCGICISDDKILMIRHKSLGKDGIFWCPPGGGVDYGETTEEALIRELKEETGLTVSVKRFMFVHEFLQPPLHAIELFFEIEVESGILSKGTDPEMTTQDQIIENIAFMSMEEIKALPSEQVHHLFTFCKNIDELRQMSGLYHFIPQLDTK